MMYEDEKQEMDDYFLSPRRMHPAGVIFSFIKVIKDSILGIGVGAFAFFRQSPTYALLFLALLILLLVVFSILSWFRHTYRVEEGELRIEQGIFIRKKRYISIHRIHKIDITANVIHRIFKLAGVKIDTASSGGGAEVSLSAVKTVEAEALRKAIKSQQSEEKISGGEGADAQYPKKAISWRRLFIAGTTSGSAGFVILAVFVLFSQVQQFIPGDVYKQTYEWIIQLSFIFIIVLFIFTLLFLWLIGIAGTMIRYGNFTIEKRPNELFIKRGLLETKELTIPFDRIQAIKIEQSILRQPLKFVRITAVIAGGSFDKGEPFPVLFPLMRVHEAAAFLKEFVPNYQTITQDLHPLHKKGRKYYLFFASIPFVFLLLPVAYFFPAFSWIPSVFVILGLLYGMLEFKESGYQMDQRGIIFRYRNIFMKTTVMTYRRRVQAIEKRQHKLQRIEKLASVKMSLIGLGGLGTHFTLRHLSDGDANHIGDWYSKRNSPKE